MGRGGGDDSGGVRDSVDGLGRGGVWEGGGDAAGQGLRR